MALNKNTEMHSAIYTGRVSHTRLVPKYHSFDYKVYMMYIDLDELDRVFKGAFCWSARRPALAWFRRKDFLGDNSESIKNEVKKYIRRDTGNDFNGSVRVLANLRYFGFIMNPIVCYYCFNSENHLEYIIAEVTNTPWKEKHAYVLACDPKQRIQRIKFQKLMHVSPFNKMDIEYMWAGNTPDENIVVRLDNWQDSEKTFTASLSLNRQSISPWSLMRTSLLYPFMTIQVCVGIYWQALKLYLKGLRFVTHPGKSAVRKTN